MFRHILPLTLDSLLYYVYLKQYMSLRIGKEMESQGQVKGEEQYTHKKVMKERQKKRERKSERNVQTFFA